MMPKPTSDADPARAVAAGGRAGAAALPLRVVVVTLDNSPRGGGATGPSGPTLRRLPAGP